MKTFLYYASLLLMLLVMSCGKQSKTEPLSGNPALSTFIEEGQNGKTLIGVANPQSGHVIITPAEYKSVTADEYTITCTRPDNKLDVFKTNGEKIGNFEMFTPWTTNGHYYLGVRYVENTYYFPKKDLIVSARDCHKEQKIMLLGCKDGWNIYDYDGNFLWTTPEKIGVIKNAKIPTEVLIAIESKDKRPSCALYNTDGSAYKAVPPAKWAKLKKQLTDVKEINQTAYAATIDSFEKL